MDQATTNQSGAGPSSSKESSTVFIHGVSHSSFTPLEEYPSSALKVGIDAADMGQYSTSSLEVFRKLRSFPSNVFCGIDMDFGDLSSDAPSSNATIDPEDNLFLKDEHASGSTKSMSHRKKALRKPRPSWLMLNQYSDMDGRVRNQSAATASEVAEEDDSTFMEEFITNEIEAVHSSFVEAQQIDEAAQSLEHPLDSSLKPVEVVPIYPDFANWGSTLELVRFDSAVTSKNDASRVVDATILVPNKTRGKGKAQTTLLCEVEQKQEERSGSAVSEYRLNREYVSAPLQAADGTFLFAKVPREEILQVQDVSVSSGSEDAWVYLPIQNRMFLDSKKNAELIGDGDQMGFSVEPLIFVQDLPLSTEEESHRSDATSSILGLAK